MKLLALPLLLFASFAGLDARDTECADSACLIESHGGVMPAGEIFSVLSPVGRASVEPIEQAPRLRTLDGKKIALVGGSFMASVTHPELKRLILNEFPTATVYVLGEVGSAGVFPGPGVRRLQVDEFQDRIKALGIDAVVSGNGGCGLCTPKETGSSIAAEYAGIPSVTIAGPGFDRQVAVTAQNNGVMVARVALYPGAFAADSRETIIANTRDILWPQIKDALTRPITDEEKAMPADDADDCRRTVYSGTLDDINRYFSDMNQGDGLPVVPPTPQRVEEFLKFGGVDYDTPIATLPIAHRRTLGVHVAACGVMAGCRPEFMPILIALTKAMGEPAFRRTLASTHAWNPYCWINGPIARQLGIDCGQGEISEEANMAIGRFMNLALKNLAGYYVKQDRMGTFGYLMPWCLVEDEEACRRAGWQPYHVQQGLDPDDSAVTVASALMWGNNMAPSTTEPCRIMQLMAWDAAERCQFALGSGKQFTHRTVLLTEPVAAILAREYPTKEALEEALVETSRRPLYERAFANYFANPGSRIDEEKFPFGRYARRLERTEEARLTDAPVWHALPDDCQSDKMMTIAAVSPGMTAFLITGDRARNKVQIMPGGGFATVRIELPANWDDLLAQKGKAGLP